MGKNRYEEKRRRIEQMQHEQAVDKFLRENDPTYLEAWDREELEYPYLSKKQLRGDKRAFTPFSPDLLDYVK